MIRLAQGNRVRRRWFLAVLIGGVGIGWYLNRPDEEAALYEVATVTRAPLTQAVTASGQLNPVVKVEVGSQISGNIEKLFADFNSAVKEGQVIAQLDPATYEANLIQAEGNLANTKGGLELARLNAERARALNAERLNPKADYDKAVADLHQAEAAVKISEGALKKAQVDLARCTIYAPIDGMVISRNVNVGQTVAASLSAPTLFVIANDLAKMQIEADVAEADIGAVQVGQEANFTVDAFPGRMFHGKVTQIRNAPKTDQNVVTYVTIIEVANPELKLKPGMTANVSIIVAQRDQALAIPNAAFRFRPSAGLEVKEAATGSQDTTRTSSPKSGGAGPRKEKRKTDRTVYVLSGQGKASVAGKPQAVQVKTGINNATFTEVVEGLKEGDRVIVGLANDEVSRRRTANPFAFYRKK